MLAPDLVHPLHGGGGKPDRDDLAGLTVAGAAGAGGQLALASEADAVGQVDPGGGVAGAPREVLVDDLQLRHRQVSGGHLGQLRGGRLRHLGQAVHLQLPAAALPGLPGAAGQAIIRTEPDALLEHLHGGHGARVADDVAEQRGALQGAGADDAHLGGLVGGALVLRGVGTLGLGVVVLALLLVAGGSLVLGVEDALNEGLGLADTGALAGGLHEDLAEFLDVEGAEGFGGVGVHGFLRVVGG